MDTVDQIKLLIGDNKDLSNPEKEVDGLLFYQNVVIDVSNGLLWTECAKISCDRDSSFRFKDAQNVIWQANRTGFLGYADWRFPTQDEILTLAACCTSVGKNARLCSKLSHLGFSDVQWNYWVSDGKYYSCFDLLDGSVGNSHSYSYLWLVRDGKTQEQRDLGKQQKIEKQRMGRLQKIEAYQLKNPDVYTEDNVGKINSLLADAKYLPDPLNPDQEIDGFLIYRDVVIDVRNGIMWSRNANLHNRGLVRFEEARETISQLKLAGHTDWRFPTWDEIQAVATNHRFVGFHNLYEGDYWVSEGNHYGYVNLPSGNTGNSWSLCRLWAVRDGMTPEQRALDKQSRLKKEEQRKKEEKRKKERLERIEAKRQKVKSELLSKLASLRKSDFLEVGHFYNEFCKEHISAGEYQKGNVEFITSWFSEHTPSINEGKIHPPDKEQASAIGAVENHTQVIARAGSGKTTTLVNRAFFLQEHCGIAPSEMMLLAFNNAAASEITDRLADRINGTTPHCMTFHALAYAIVHPEECILYDNQNSNHLALSSVFQNIIEEHLHKPKFEELVREVMLLHFRQDWERILSSRLNLGKEEMLLLRRSRPNESLSGYSVKSFGEKIIADFLFEHDVPYKYERNHFWGDVNYRPDFTVFISDNSGIIIEYFGLDGDADYDEMSAAKRVYWATKDNWQLLEYKPSDIASVGVDRFKDRLKKDLELCGVVCNRLSEDEVWARLKNGGVIDRFTGIVKNFILSCRKNWILPDDLCRMIKDYTAIADSEEKFNYLALYIYNVYLERINATGEDDFDGLMQNAATKIEAGHTRFERKSGGGDLKELKFVFIDEFQDFSEHFWRMVNAMLKQNPEINFFCVGDDWQAINAFAGSDLKFFSNFKGYLNDSKLNYIATNYRSSQNIVNLGNKLMDGTGKLARASKASLGEVVYADLAMFMPNPAERERHSIDKITPAVVRLVSEALSSGSNVVMLSRNNFLPYYLSDTGSGNSSDNKLYEFLISIRSYFPETLHEKVSVSTTHKYKGKEKQTVIILDAISRCYPQLHPDWVFSRILGTDPMKIVEEEKRLFYVAITRAIDKLVIITESHQTSPFFDCLKSESNLTCVNWEKLAPPPALEGAGVIMVKVTNQPGRGISPSYNRRDLLKAAGYDWDMRGLKGWVKVFPASKFGINALKGEVWAINADGLEVRLLDAQQIEQRRYLVNNGLWEDVSIC